MAHLVKNPLAMWETWVQSLDWKIPWRGERLPTPVFLPGEFHGLYSPWGCKQLVTTEQLSLRAGLEIKDDRGCCVRGHCITKEQSMGSQYGCHVGGGKQGI